MRHLRSAGHPFGGVITPGRTLPPRRLAATPCAVRLPRATYHPRRSPRPSAARAMATLALPQTSEVQKSSSGRTLKAVPPPKETLSGMKATCQYMNAEEGALRAFNATRRSTNGEEGVTMPLRRDAPL